MPGGAASAGAARSDGAAGAGRWSVVLVCGRAGRASIALEAIAQASIVPAAVDPAPIARAGIAPAQIGLAEIVRAAASVVAAIGREVVGRPS